MMALGVFLGAPSPSQAIASYPGENSPRAGTSGSASRRLALVTASARSLPERMYPMLIPIPRKVTSARRLDALPDVPALGEFSPREHRRHCHGRAHGPC